MAKKKSDITTTGALTYKDLQEMNQMDFANPFTQDDLNKYLEDNNIIGSSQALSGALSRNAQYSDVPVQSPISRMSDGEDYWGNSFFDDDIIEGEGEFERASDIRAENQPWYSKIGNGLGKAVVTAGTTILETAGLIFGAQKGVYDALQEDGDLIDKGGAWLHSLWDNPITRALQAVNEFSEKWMPNYYTQDEQENPFSNIFTANFLGDKIIKNLGFVVGVYYGGIPASKVIGAIGSKIGSFAIKAAKAETAVRANRGAIAAGLREARATAKKVATSGEEYQKELTRLLKRSNLSPEQRAARAFEGMDRVRNIAKTTKATSMFIGSLGSAVNEGAIEAINNSKDWAEKEQMEAKDEYERLVTAAQKEYGGTELEKPLIDKFTQEYNTKLAEIEKGRARMGNADLLLNIPVLTATNMFELGHLYARGFTPSKRRVGSFLTGNKLKGSLAESTLKTRKTRLGAITKAVMNSNAEGMEEYLQRAASDGAGNAVSESIERFINIGKGEEAKNEVDDYIVGFGKAIADNFNDPHAWEEYMIGALSSMVGMPVFGTQTKNAYFKVGPVGFAGGFVGTYSDYMDEKKKEKELANYLNGRVKSDDFKALYRNLQRRGDLDKLLQLSLSEDNKKFFEDIKFDQLFEDIDAASSAGMLEEFKALVGYNDEFSDKELEDIVKNTQKTYTKKEQLESDKFRRDLLQGILEIEDTPDAPEGAKEGVKEIKKEIDELNKKIAKGEEAYEDIIEGPFIEEVNGKYEGMNTNNREKMVDILKKNKENILEAIDNYVKVRNDIDIETGGILKDDQIRFLTKIKSTMLNYTKREAGMSYEIVKDFREANISRDDLLKLQNLPKKIEDAQKEYNAAKKAYEDAAEKKAKPSEIEKKKSAMEMAEKALNGLKSQEKGVDTLYKILQVITGQKDMDISEIAGTVVGELGGKIRSLFMPSGLSRLFELYGEDAQRDTNADELEWILGSPNVADVLTTLVNSLNLDIGRKRRLRRNIYDLAQLSEQKKKYKEKLKEYLGNTDLINEAYKNEEDKMSKKERDNKLNELALKIGKVNNLTELDNLMKDARNSASGDFVSEAYKRAKEKGDENMRKMLEDYEKGYNLLDSFDKELRKYNFDAASGVSQVSVAEWNNALGANLDLYNNFINGLLASAKALEETNSEVGKREAEVIRKILNDLKAVADSVATNNSKKVEKPKDNRSDESADAMDEEFSRQIRKKHEEAARMKAAAAKQKAEEEKKNGPEDSDASTDSREDLIKSVKAELLQILRDNPDKDTLGKSDLSNSLRARIDKYNKSAKDEDKITDNEIAKIGEQYLDGIDSIDPSSDDENDNGVDSITPETVNSDISATMKEQSRANFKGDLITQHVSIPPNNKIKTPYTPTSSRGKAIKQLLEELKAYDFVNNNLLGYILNYIYDAQQFDDSVELPAIHFLQSTNSVFDKEEGKENSEPIVFLALEWTKDCTDALKKNIYDGKDFSIEANSNINLVTINGKKYQILGALSADSTANPEVKKACKDFKIAIDEELKDAKAEERNKAEESRAPFVVSSKSTTDVSILTGRLDVTEGKKSSLLDLMNESSSEWKNGMPFYFGVNVNGHISIDPKMSDVDRQDPNASLLSLSKHNGAIFLYVTRPDGFVYPIRCTRKTVSEWWKDTKHQDLIWDLLRNNHGNEYLGKIVDNIKTLLDVSKTREERVKAKMALTKYFTIPPSTIHFDDFNTVTISFSGSAAQAVSSYDSSAASKEDIENSVFTFFSSLAQEGNARVRFTVPNPVLDYGNISGRSIIEADVLEVGLNSMNNFNASVLITPLNTNGEVIELGSGENPITSVVGVRPGLYTLTLGKGKPRKTYKIDGDGNVTATDEEGKDVDVDKEEIEIIRSINNLDINSLPSLFDYYLSSKIKDSAAKRMLLTSSLSNNIGKFKDIKYFIDGNNKCWFLDPNNTKQSIILVEGEGIETTEEYHKMEEKFSEALQSVLWRTKESKQGSTSIINKINNAKTLEELNDILLKARKDEKLDKDIAEAYDARIKTLSDEDDTGSNEDGDLGDGNPPGNNGEPNESMIIYSGSSIEQLDTVEGDAAGFNDALVNLYVGKGAKNLAERIFKEMQNKLVGLETLDDLADLIWNIGDISTINTDDFMNDFNNILNGCFA